MKSNLMQSSLYTFMQSRVNETISSLSSSDNKNTHDISIILDSVNYATHRAESIDKETPESIAAMRKVAAANTAAVITTFPSFLVGEWMSNHKVMQYVLLYNLAHSTNQLHILEAFTAAFDLEAVDLFMLVDNKEQLELYALRENDFNKNIMSDEGWSFECTVTDDGTVKDKPLFDTPHFTFDKRWNAYECYKMPDCSLQWQCTSSASLQRSSGFVYYFTINRRKLSTADVLREIGIAETNGYQLYSHDKEITTQEQIIKRVVALTS